MNDTYTRLGTTDVEATEVIDWFRAGLLAGNAWCETLLGAIGRWSLAEEYVDGIKFQYLLLGEAFDWLMLAGRFVSEAGDLIPRDEKEELLFHNRMPEEVPEAQFRNLIGPDKYRAHLNYFYGVVVEESLLLAVEDDIRKECIAEGVYYNEHTTDRAYIRLYCAPQRSLMTEFFQDMRRAANFSMSVTELKEFTYWLFKRRVNLSDSAKVASDTKKGLERLFSLC